MTTRPLACLVLAGLLLAAPGCGGDSGSDSPDPGYGGDVGDPGVSPDLPPADGFVISDLAGPQDPSGDPAFPDIPSDEPADVLPDAPSPDTPPDLPGETQDDGPAGDPGDDPDPEVVDATGDPGEETAGDLPVDPGSDPGHPVCAVDNGGCSPHAACVDNVPLPDCYCLAGFTGDGRSCDDIDECAKGIATCDVNATCHNQEGSYECLCNVGYEGSGASCTDVNECALSPGPCGVDSWCTNHPGGYSCSCDLGATGSGSACRWTSQVSGSGQDDVRAVAMDTPMNTYALLSISGFANDRPAAGGDDVALVKYDYAGAREWIRTFGSRGADGAGGLALDAAGNIYLAGSASDSIDGVAFNGWSDAFVAKYSPGGERLWLILLGTAVYEAGLGIAVFGDSVFVSGYTNGTMPGEVSQGGSTDAFVARVDMDGALKWVRQFGSDAEDRASVVAVAPSGLVLVGGTTRGNLVADGLQGDSDGFLAAFDLDGNATWVRQFGSFAGEEVGALSVDAGGNAWLAGWTSGTLPGQASAGGTDAFLIRHAPDGTATLVTQFGTPGSDMLHGIVADSEGAWAAGTFGQPPAGQAGLGASDAVVLRLNLDGVPIRTQVLGTSLDDSGRSVAVANDGSLRVGIQTWADLTGRGHAGDPDAAVLALDADLGTTWARQTDSRMWTVGTHVVLDTGDVAWVMGSTRGNVGGGLERTWGSDVFLDKVLPNGTVAWRRQLGTPFNETAAGVALGPDAVVAVASSAGLPGGDLNPNRSDVLLASYGLDGVPGPVANWGTTEDDQATAAAGDAAGNIFVAGTTLGSLDTPNAGGLDLFVAKFGPDLQPLWARQMGTTKNDYFHAVAAHPNGGVVAAGQVLGPLPGAVQAGGTTGSGGAVVARYDTDGTRLWLVQVGAEYSDACRAIAIDKAGDILLAGTAYGTIADVNRGMTDLFVMKLAGSDGTVLWARQFGTTGADEGRGIALAPDGGVWVIGRIDGDLGATVDGSLAAGGTDIAVVRVDADGSNVTLRQVGSVLDDSGEGIAIDSHGDRLMLGWTQGSLDLKSPGGIEGLLLMKR